MNSFQAEWEKLAFPFWSEILQIFIAKLGRIYEKTSNVVAGPEGHSIVAQRFIAG